MKTKALPKKDIIPQALWKLYTFTFGEFWAFNLLEYTITNEAFCCGTEDALTELYKLRFGKDKGWSADMNITFSLAPQENAISTWDFIEIDPRDPRAGYYLDTTTGLRIWLCELWTNMWGEHPQQLFLSIDPA